MGLQRKRRKTSAGGGSRYSRAGMGWYRAISISILAQIVLVALNALQERVNDPYSVEHLAMLQVFAEQHPASSLLGHAQYQSIPKRKTVNAVNINGGKNVSDCRFPHDES